MQGHAEHHLKTTCHRAKKVRRHLMTLATAPQQPTLELPEWMVKLDEAARAHPGERVASAGRSVFDGETPDDFGDKNDP